MHGGLVRAVSGEKTGRILPIDGASDRAEGVGKLLAIDATDRMRGERGKRANRSISGSVARTISGGATSLAPRESGRAYQGMS